VRSGQPGETVFQRAGAIVHLSRNDKKLTEGQVDENYHEKNALLSIPAKRGWLADRIDSAITFKRFARPAGAPTKDVEPADASAKDVKPADAKKIKKGTWVDCDVPKELVVRLLELSTKWKFPALAGTIEAPTLRKDGTVLDVPGYDPKSGLFFDPGGVVFRKITDKPTKKEMVDSLALLKDVIRDFPFVDDDDDESAEGENRGRLSRAVALAGMLLAVSRRSLPTAPAIGIDANQAQTGKTLLAQVMAIMNTGRKTAERPLSGSEEERRKTIGSALVAADPVILFDNIEGMSIGGAFISMVLTAESFADRKLGVHEQIGAPTNALMLFTGNHLTVAGDATAGRVLISKIVTETKLKDRKFEHRDLETYVKENRPALVHAALTILRGFIVADRPGIPSRSRFREFGDLIGNALVYLGEMDPCLSEDAVQILDPIKEGQSSVARAWWKEFRDAPVTVRKLLDYAEPAPETRGDDYPRYTHPIAVAIADALDIRPNDVTAQKAASFLTSCVGVDLGDFRVHRERKTSALNHAVRWRCEKRPDPLD
jgi:hypothetical protein